VQKMFSRRKWRHAKICCNLFCCHSRDIFIAPHSDCRTQCRYTFFRYLHSTTWTLIFPNTSSSLRNITHVMFILFGPQNYFRKHNVLNMNY
jgi:hypothetical protein